MTEGFYSAFEDKFRGTRETIRRRLDFYLPFLRPLLSFYPSGNVIDLGCGRGEWLELLRIESISSMGVDADQGMLDACRMQNLPVKNCDAIEFLTSLPDESQVVVSAFHLVEHIPFASLMELACQALRVLKPGGLVILETPNPENLLVATSAFYLDPTHKQPIPPQLLSFVPEYTGFARTKILRLQESPDLANALSASLLDVLSGVSPDYAVIAQKSGPEALAESLSPLFNADYGLTLVELASRFQANLECKFFNAESRAEQVEARLEQVEARAEQYASQLLQVYSSSSWRLTVPLRGTVDFLRAAREKYHWRSAKKIFKKLIILPIDFVSSRPSLKRGFIMSARFFHVAEPIRHIYWLLIERDRPAQDVQTCRSVSPDQLCLNTRARQIYVDLQSAIAQKESEKG